MLDLDSWQEILDTVRKNKLRTFLTGFSVAWGIFMLLVLLGSGQGLGNGVEYQFRDDAINSIWISQGQTSMPHKGFKPGRSVQFRNADFDEFERAIPGMDHITGRFYIRGTLTVSRGNQSGSYDVRSVHPDHQYLEKTLVVKGRFLNELDMKEHRKVAVLGKLVASDLFKNGEEPVGGWIKINNIPFRVVGVFEDDGGENEMQKIYLPVATSQRTFNGADRLSNLMFTTGDADLPESEKMAEEARTILSRRHSFDPDDKRAIFLRNNYENYQRISGVIGGIRAFVWVIGIGTLLAGVVGVSNIMLISVRERTKEIGVRKALGATPASVIGMVLKEAVLITSVAGYVGLVLGVALLEVAAANLSGAEMFRNPNVDLRVAIYATLLLVLAGAAAGFVPARRAAAIRPVEALRDE